MKTMLKRLVVLMVVSVLAVMTIVPTTATETNAATNQKTMATKPYTDVTVKSVGKDAYVAITYIKKHHGFENVIAGQKFRPYKNITRREFIMVLVNLYGAKYIPVTVADIQKANTKITSQWACDKMVSVADRLGCKIRWKAGKDKLTRAGASQYIKVFADFRSTLKPKH